MFSFSRRKRPIRLIYTALVFFGLLWWVLDINFASPSDGGAINKEQYESLTSVDQKTISSSIYVDLINKYGLQNFAKTPFKDKCKSYFDHILDEKIPVVMPDTAFSFDRSVFSDPSKAENTKKWSDVQKEEQFLHDQFTHIKLFDTCYLRPSHERVKNPRFSIFGELFKGKGLSKAATCSLVERKLFPWLTFEFPSVVSWNGTVTDYFDKGNRDSMSDCFLSRFQSNLKGKGIVLTLADKHLEDAIRLIKTLRYHDNELPIQVIYFNNLSPYSRQKLHQAGTTTWGIFGKKLRAQNISFIDVSPAISTNYLYKFEGFGNKILASMFNTFEEMIFLDADTVILESPQFFFDREKYNSTGTLFFKDRSTVEYRPTSDVVFFEKLMPSTLDNLFFGIPKMTSYTFNREFFKKRNHYMESGLLLVNRKKHFLQTLIMSQLNFHINVQARLYGDKELFWIALLIGGHENYAFNEHFSASIGISTPSNEWSSNIGTKELCSNHPGHINDEDNYSLLWFNSGFRHCSKHDQIDTQREFSAGKRYTDLKTFESFQDFFSGQLQIKEAVIPPSKIIEADNLQNEPSRSWINMRDYCDGYTWCAYSKIGSFEDGSIGTSPDTSGFYIKFEDKEIDKYDRVGKVWMDNTFILY